MSFYWISIKKLIQSKSVLRSSQSIPAGVKASIRGYRFNEIVYSYLSNIISVKKKPEILLTKESFPDCINVHTHLNEIPDWCVINKKTKRVMIGYNQIDLWTGGAQCNRADKYLQNHALFKILERKYKCTLVCVIAAPLPSSMRKTSTPSTSRYNVTIVGGNFEKNPLYLSCFISSI